jgi:hypothetical protein
MKPALLRRVILAAYPADFRARYGDELAAVVADCEGGWRVKLDLAAGAAKARLNPDFVISQPEGRRLRLQATTSTVFALWAWSIVAVAVFARAVDDQPVPGLRSWGWGAYAAGTAIFELSAGVILLAGFAYWLRVVIPALQTKNKKILVPAVVPVAVVLIWLACTGLLAAATHHIQPGNYRHISAQGPHTAAGWAVLTVYAAFSLTCVLACTGSIERALNNAELPERLLTASALVGAAAATALAAVAICAAVSVSRVLLIGGIPLGDEFTAIGAVCFLVLTSVSAVVSSRRGLVTIRTSTPL